MREIRINRLTFQLLLAVTMLIFMASCGSVNNVDPIFTPISSTMISPSPIPADHSKPEQSPTDSISLVSEQPSPAATEAAAQPSTQARESAAPVSPSSAPISPTAVPTPAASVKAVKGILLSIIGDDKLGVILESTLVEVEGEISVISLLQKETRKEKIQMESSGKGIFAYVNGIANLYEFDRGAKSGWLFKVNGEFSDKGAGSYKVKAGDQVEWLYTLDLGKDVGVKR